MQGPKRDPYLWVHLAGLAALPLCAELCLLGLAAGDPLLPGGWDWLLVGLLGAAPIAAMQWLRPYYPFSVALVSLRADRLDETQQRILQRWQSWEPKAIALAVPILVLWALQWLDRLSPVAATIAPLDNRALGLLVVWLGSLLANLFLAIALASLWVLLTPTAAFEAIEPFPLGDVPGSFLRLSLRLTKVLPPLLDSEPLPAPNPAPVVAETAAPSEQLPEQPTEQAADQPVDNPAETESPEPTESSAPIGEAFPDLDPSAGDGAIEEAAVENPAIEDGAIEDSITDSAVENAAVEDPAIEDSVITSPEIQDSPIENSALEDSVLEDSAIADPEIEIADHNAENNAENNAEP